MPADQAIQVISADGQYVGELAHVVADHMATSATGLVVRRNGNEIVVPLDAVKTRRGTDVLLSEPLAAYQDLPLFQRRTFRVIDEEIAREQRARELGIDEDFQIGSEEDEDEPATW